MAVSEEKAKGNTKLEEVFGLDLRSLALFRVGLALVILADLAIRAGDLTAHYSDQGVLPRTALEQILQPWYWSVNVVSGQPFVQALLFGLAILVAAALLVGYRTRLATIATWAMIISIHNRNPALIFAGDDVLRALLFWSMFLPLGAYYSIDSALNTSREPLPKRILTWATVAFTLQQCYIYIFSAFFKAQSPLWWPDGDAVYYAFQFDQYGTALGQFFLNFPGLLKLMTLSALWFEWFGPLLLFIPFRTSFFRCAAVVLFIGLHLNFGLFFTLGIFPFLSIASWFAFIPSTVWNALDRRIANSRRAGLRIYYDAECGFCKKVVHLIRTFLILPRTPLLLAQSDDSIHADMQEKNSWVVVDWQERHYKWEAIAYVCSLSPIFWFLAPILRWGPLMGIGNKIYETIATNRRFMGRFTAPLKWKPLKVRPSSWLNIAVLLLLVYATVWNVRSLAFATFNRDHFVAQTFRRRTFNSLDWFSRLTRLDQSWSIFAPTPPRDDGWHVVEGTLADGSTVDVLRDRPVTWEKPSLGERNALYKNMQWRTYFINLNRAIGEKLYPGYGDYLCRRWNAQHAGGKLDSLIIYFMDERTVPPGEVQQVEKKAVWEQACLEEPDENNGTMNN